MNLTRINNTWFGFTLGVIAPVFGFLLYGLYYSWQYNATVSYFINSVFLGTPSYQSPIISLSLIADLGVFFLLLRFKYNKAAQGVVYALLAYVPLVVYLRFF